MVFVHRNVSVGVKGCPYKKECGVKYTNKYYCGTAKHLKCIEFQALRDKENKDKCSECGGSRYLSKLSVLGGLFLHKNGCSKKSKDKCSECGGFRMGGVVIHIDGCSKSATTTTGESMDGYYDKSE